MKDNEKLINLVSNMHSALQKFCDESDSCNCPLWPDKEKQCDLRDLEDKMQEFGIAVEE